MGELLKNLGITLVVTGVVFILMVFCAIPICCFEKNDEPLQIEGRSLDDQTELAVVMAKPVETGSQKFKANQMV